MGVQRVWREEGGGAGRVEGGCSRLWRVGTGRVGGGGRWFGGRRVEGGRVGGGGECSGFEGWGGGRVLADLEGGVCVCVGGGCLILTSKGVKLGREGSCQGFYAADLDLSSGEKRQQNAGSCPEVHIHMSASCLCAYVWRMGRSLGSGGQPTVYLPTLKFRGPQSCHGCLTEANLFISAPKSEAPIPEHNYGPFCT